MTSEEQQLFDELKAFKREKELLYVIFEEVNDLIKSGYDGPFMGEEVRGIFYAVNEYNKWKNNERRRKEQINS